MTIHLDGIGDDWVVTRRPGGKPELSHFSSLDELRHVLNRALLKAGPAPKKPEPLPQAPLPVVVPPAVEARRNGTGRMSHPPQTKLDCTTCGACCTPEDGVSKTWVRVEKGDRDQIGRRLPIMRKPGGDYIQTRRNADGDVVCAALDGSVGSSCNCSVYNDRPLVCRLFEVGGDECLKARERLKLNA